MALLHSQSGSGVAGLRWEDYDGCQWALTSEAASLQVMPTSPVPASVWV